MRSGVVPALRWLQGAHGGMETKGFWRPGVLTDPLDVQLRGAISSSSKCADLCPYHRFGATMQQDKVHKLSLGMSISKVTLFPL